VLRFALSTLRARRSLFVGSLACVALALLFLTAAGVLLESALRGHGAANRFAAAPVVVAGNAHLGLDGRDHPPGFGDVDAAVVPRPLIPAELVDRVGGVEGVRGAIPDLSFYAQPVGADGRPVTPPDGERTLGHSWASAPVTPFALREGTPPEGPGDVVVDAETARRAGLRVGAELTVLTSAEGRGSYRISGIAAAPDGGLTRDQTALFFSQETADRLAPPGGLVHAVAILVADGADRRRVADRVRAALGDRPGLEVLADSAETEVSGGDLRFVNTIVFVVSMGSLSVFVALFVMASGFAFATAQRHREFALLRVVGATPGQIRRMLAWETLLVAVLGAALALPAGAALAGPLARRLVDLGVAPEELTVRVGPWPLAAAAGCGVVITQLAALSAARRAARVRPAQALGDAERPARALPLSRALTGLAFLVGTGLLVAFGVALGGLAGSGLAFGGVLTLLIATALLGPALLRPVVPLLGLLIRAIARRTGRLALANSSAGIRRVAAATVPIVLMTGFTVAALFLQTTQQATAAEWAGERLAATHVLLPDGAAGLPPALADDAARLPGVATVSATATSWVRASVHTDEAESVPAPALSVDGRIAEVLDLHVTDGGLAGVAAGTAVAVSEEWAGEYGWRVGEDVRLRLPDGTGVELTIGARYDRSLGFADLLVPAAVLRPHTPDPLLDAVYLVADPAADPARLGAALDELTGRWPSAAAADRAEVEAAGAENAVTETWPVYLFGVLTAAFTALALANTQVMATLARADEFATLRLAGATRRNVLALVTWESVLVGAAGTLLGGAVAAVTLAGSSLALTGGIRVHGPPGFALAVGAGALALAVASALVPAWRMQRYGAPRPAGSAGPGQDPGTDRNPPQPPREPREPRERERTDVPA
jgi:putative ABC transport system permease protein